MSATQPGVSLYGNWVDDPGGLPGHHPGWTQLPAGPVNVKNNDASISCSYTKRWLRDKGSRAPRDKVHQLEKRYANRINPPCGLPGPHLGYPACE
jgi:hypothetical protein